MRFSKGNHCVQRVVSERKDGTHRYLHTSSRPYELTKVDKRLEVVVNKKNDQSLVLIGSQPI